ncbi:MAG: molybdenum cofactor guanylyltransferase [Chloroflexi bacterium]|nr:molybdenum cofactor guanylyltransferase [Chloroflexota bacterium]MDL1884962.1 molybdenum cofactor guanylyltransferase [Anaerolineae bacterium CFX8]
MLTTAILAGGRSRRMGSDKALLVLKGKPVLRHVIERAALHGAAIILIANEPEKYASFGLPIFPDVKLGAGSLGGLYTALAHSPTDYALCVACDMPLLNTNLLIYLAGLREGYDAVVPRIEGRPEPFHAVYRKTCLESIRSRLERGQLRVSDFYQDVSTRYIEEADLRQIDPELHSFLNINTPDDLARLQALLG